MVKKTKDVALLAGLVYFTQGALGVVGVALPVYLRGLGWSISEIAVISSIVAFPWVLKIFYGLLSDCLPIFGYRRKSYLILFPVLAGIGWLSLSLLPGTRMAVAFSLILANLGFAATDVITDGLIVEHSRGSMSHFYQSVAWGTRSVGAIVSGVTGGWLAAHWRPQAVFLVATALPLLTILIAFKIHERRRTGSPFASLKEPLGRCLQILRQPAYLWFMGFMVVMQVSASFGVPFFFHMKENLGFPETYLGFLMSLAWTGAVIASVFYAWASGRIPLEKIMKWAVLLNGLNILSTLLITGRWSAFLFIFLGGMLGCLIILPVMATAAIFSRQTGVEGTLFAILMSLFNLGQIGFGFLGGKMYPVVGLPALIVFSAVIALMAYFMIPRLALGTMAHSQGRGVAG